MARAGDLVVVFNISFNLVAHIDDSVVVTDIDECCRLSILSMHVCENEVECKRLLWDIAKGTAIHDAWLTTTIEYGNH